MGGAWPMDWGQAAKTSQRAADRKRPELFLLDGLAWAMYLGGSGDWIEREIHNVMNEEKVDTNQKALQINLDARKYGTFAVIGAGQEVARCFFHVGGAAGARARTNSANGSGVEERHVET